MKKLLLALLFSTLLLNAAEVREDFSHGDPKNKNFPTGWKSEGVLPGVPATKVYVKDGILHLEADKSSGGLIKVMKGVDLNKTPVMRWRWRATLLPAGADGTDPDKDDQAVGIYIGMPGFLNKKSVSYHYETVTPKDVWGETSYILGVIKVKFLAVRNQTDKLGEWYVEERNVTEDLKKQYGEVPKEFAVSIIANAHNTQTKGAAEVDYIEFVAAPAAKK